ncbi:hypothetical protein [Streptomyces coeruleorubidus]|uniref:hypothetical protein n=1 Tax=Streptomyces coeruleorubidus TaxID=116188 RepID=UPI003CD009FD
MPAPATTCSSPTATAATASTPPTPETLAYSFTLPAALQSPAIARAATRTILRAHGLGDLTDAAVQVVSELASGDAAAALEGKVANASDANKLAEARAEVNAVRRAADDAAPGSQVDAGVGGKMNRKEADLGDGERVNLDEIPDADVVYKDRSGTVHVKEVKNAGSATRKADFANQGRAAQEVGEQGARPQGHGGDRDGGSLGVDLQRVQARPERQACAGHPDGGR